MFNLYVQYSDKPNYCLVINCHRLILLINDRAKTAIISSIPEQFKWVNWKSWHNTYTYSNTLYRVHNIFSPLVCNPKASVAINEKLHLMLDNEDWKTVLLWQFSPNIMSVIKKKCSLHWLSWKIKLGESLRSFQESAGRCIATFLT